jgi:hypothetical protein
MIMNDFDTIVVTHNDIVCGRGKGFENLVANQTFRRIIDENASWYSSRQKNRTEKSILIRLISHQLKEKGMRFVKRAQDGWKVLDEKQVFLKVSLILDHLDATPISSEEPRSRQAEQENKTKHFSLYVSDWPRTSRCNLLTEEIRGEDYQEGCTGC